VSRMRWPRTFLSLDGFITLLITAILSYISHNKPLMDIPKAVLAMLKEM